MGNQSWKFFERHFGPERLKHYLADTGGNTAKAEALYEWNVDAAAAFWGSLGHLEIALRNTIDGRMTARHAKLGRLSHWIFDDSHEFGRRNPPSKNKYPYADVATAKRRVTKNGKPVTPSQVISEVSFGFWHQMVSQGQMMFWPDIATGFPHAPDRAQDTVQEPISRLRNFRNRIGHHHRIWSEDLHARYDDLLTVTGYIDPDLRIWIDTQSAVPAILSNRPA